MPPIDPQNINIFLMNIVLKEHTIICWFHFKAQKLNYKNKHIFKNIGHKSRLPALATQPEVLKRDMGVTG